MPLRRTLAPVLAAALLAGPAHAADRIALLIGNQAYNAKVGPLENPHNDVALVGAALRSLKFQVTEIKDADYRAIDTSINLHIQSVRRAGDGAISLIYYAGHGAANADTKINYLIPVDAASADDESLWTQSINLNRVIDSLREQAPAATHYVVFDACRTELNLMRKGKRTLADRGFVPITYTPGMMIAYATAPGKTASDVGAGGGTYAKALAAEMVKPGIEAVTMFRNVALRVNREIGQDPWMSASTLPEVYLAGDAGKVSASTPATSGAHALVAEAERAWAHVRETANIAALEAFAARYRGTFYADLARGRVDELKKQQVAVAAPPVPKEPARTIPHTQQEQSDTGPIVVSAGGAKRFRVGMGKSVEVTPQRILVAVREPDLQRNSIGIRMAGRGTRMGVGQEFPLAPYGGGSCRLALLEVAAEHAGLQLRC